MGSPNQSHEGNSLTFAANPEVEKIGDLYTVDMLVHYVQSKLSA